MLKVIIYDEEKKLYDDHAFKVYLPGESWELELMAFHAPLISLLKAGNILVDGKVLSIQKGIAKMENNELLVLVER